MSTKNEAVAYGRCDEGGAVDAKVAEAAEKAENLKPDWASA